MCKRWPAGWSSGLAPVSVEDTSISPSSCRVRRGASLLVAVAALAFQLVNFHDRPSNNSDDFTAYIRNAQSLVAGTRYGMPGYILNPVYDQADSGQGAYPPGYPIVLAPVVAFARDPVVAAALLNCVLYAGFIGLLVLFAAPAAGLAGAVGVGLVAGISPVFMDQGALRTPTESLFLLVMIAGFLSDRLVRPDRPGRSWPIVLMGGLVAAAALIRITGVLLLPAVVLADIVRRRRLAWPPILVSVVAGAVVVAVILVAGRAYVIENIGVLTTPGPARSGAPLARHLTVILENVRDMPGNLVTLFTWQGAYAPPETGAWGLTRKALGLGVLVLAALGFVVQVRRRVSMVEVYFLLQIALLLNLTEILRSPRYWLPVSVLTLVYAAVGGAAVGAWAARRLAPGQPASDRGGVIGALAVCLTAFGLACGSDWVSASRPDRYSLTESRAVDAFRQIAASTPAHAVIVTRRPRTVVFYTARSAVDYHLSPANPAFQPWAKTVGATHLLHFIDQPDVRAVAQRLGLPANDAGLTVALDAYEAVQFGAEQSRMMRVFDNGRYRLYRLPSQEAAR